MHCPKCNSNNIVKNGRTHYGKALTSNKISSRQTSDPRYPTKQVNTRTGIYFLDLPKQRFKCQNCGRQFVEIPTPQPIDYSKSDFIDKLLLERLS